MRSLLNSFLTLTSWPNRLGSEIVFTMPVVGALSLSRASIPDASGVIQGC
jgi:hypothetical protein